MVNLTERCIFEMNAFCCCVDVNVVFVLYLPYLPSLQGYFTTKSENPYYVVSGLQLKLKETFH